MEVSKYTNYMVVFTLTVPDQYRCVVEIVADRSSFTQRTLVPLQQCDAAQFKVVQVAPHFWKALIVSVNNSVLHFMRRTTLQDGAEY